MVRSRCLLAAGIHDRLGVLGNKGLVPAAVVVVVVRGEEVGADREACCLGCRAQLVGVVRIDDGCRLGRLVDEDVPVPAGGLKTLYLTC